MFLSHGDPCDNMHEDLGLSLSWGCFIQQDVLYSDLSGEEHWQLALC